jgi:DNA-binding cell septation regulator SpoVG
MDMAMRRRNDPNNQDNIHPIFQGIRNIHMVALYNVFLDKDKSICAFVKDS